MEFINLKQQYETHQALIDAAIKRVFSHGQFVLGPEVNALEQALAKRANVKHCVAMSNGTTALQAALMALDIGPGDEVIVPAFSFFASASTVVLVGAKPIFVDIDPQTYNIDVHLIEDAITPKTKAIVAVDLFGQPAQYDAIWAIANQHNLSVLGDAAQSIGALYQGQPACSLGSISCVSFYPAKVLGCYGEGGACFTNDDRLAHRLRVLGNQGQDGKYHHTMIGLNARLSTIQAAALLAKLDFFDDELAHRRASAALYNEQLCPSFTTPYIHLDCESSYTQYTIQVEDRDMVQAVLRKQGIPTVVHYPKGIHQQPVMIERGFSGDFPVTEGVASRVLSLPLDGYITPKEVSQVASALLGIEQYLES